MSNFVFAPAIQAGIDSGIYEIMRNQATGQLMSIARDKATGKIVSHAVQTIISGSPLNPLTLPLQMGQMGLSGLQMYQTHRGFTATLEGIQAIQSSLAVLQATTAFIGLGVAVNTGLSAVNLWQTFKLREDIKQLKYQIRDGFLDLKQALQNQSKEVIQQLEYVANDIKFEQHRLELIKAYGRFMEANKFITMCLSCDDESIRNADLANARQTLSEALAIYNNPHLLSETTAAGQLRRLECAWLIELSIIATYKLQNQANVVVERLSHLQETIKYDCLKILEHNNTTQEISFLFPEIKHIYDHDLVAIENWKNHTQYAMALSPSEQQELNLLAINNVDINQNIISEKPQALMEYETSVIKSHPKSLKDQLKFKFSPSLRSQYETKISHRAKQENYTALINSNLKQASDLTIANLYWYFQDVPIKQIIHKNTINVKLEALRLELNKS
jgi:hypothetical protein